MACPVCTGGGAFLLLTGIYSVFFQDRRLRRVWWAVLIALIASWLAYFFAFERPLGLRYSLEVFSVLFLLVISARLLQLVVRDGLRPPGTVLLARWSKAARPVTLNPITVMLKTFIITILIVELTGKVDFAWDWYLYPSALLLIWMGLLIYFTTKGAVHWQRFISQTRFGRIFFSNQAEAGCPLGFGKRKE